MDDKELLLHTMDLLHTTTLGEQRIKKNLAIDVPDLITWCKEQINNTGSRIERVGKNYHVHVDDFYITINALSYTIITAHKLKVKKSSSSKKLHETWVKDGYELRPSQKRDAHQYYEENFQPLHADIVYYTGGKEVYSRVEVVSFFTRCVDDQNRYDFLIVDPQGKIIGESVLNEINWELRCANYRIAIFHPEACGKGIGSWAIKKTRDFAFEELKLHRLSLDVFSYNTRAKKAYLAAGFKREGVLRDAIKHGETYADDILMAILEDEWRNWKD